MYPIEVGRVYEIAEREIIRITYIDNGVVWQDIIRQDGLRYVGGNHLSTLGCVITKSLTEADWLEAILRGAYVRL